jgi:hypothetical protein
LAKVERAALDRARVATAEAEEEAAGAEERARLDAEFAEAMARHREVKAMPPGPELAAAEARVARQMLRLHRESLALPLI